MDAAAIAARGVQRPDVTAAIGLIVGGAHIGELIEAGRRIPIRLEIAGAPSDAADPASIAGLLPSLRVRAGKDLAPLSSLVQVTVAAEPGTILRHGRRRAVEVWFQPKPGTAAEQTSAAAAARRAADAARLPAGIAVARP
jgi:multidrug efflux pump subunit AcrB